MDMALDCATVDLNVGRVPRTVYLKSIVRKMEHKRHIITYMSIYKSLCHGGDISFVREVYLDEVLSVCILDHLPAPTPYDWPLQSDILCNLCRSCSTAHIDVVVGCVQRLASRMTEIGVDTTFMQEFFNCTLRSMPMPLIRDALVAAGGYIEEWMDDYVCLCAFLGDACTVYDRLTTGTDINERDSDGRSLLMCAVRSGNSALVKMLLEREPCPDDRDDLKILEESMKMGDTNILELFLEHDRFDAWYRYGQNPVWDYVTTVPVAKWLLEHSMTTKNAIAGVAMQSDLQVLEYLVEVARLTVPPDVLTAMGQRSVYADLDVLDYLIAHGADITARDSSGESVADYLPLYSDYWTLCT